MKNASLLDVVWSCRFSTLFVPVYATQSRSLLTFTGWAWLDECCGVLRSVDVLRFSVRFTTSSSCLWRPSWMGNTRHRLCRRKSRICVVQNGWWIVVKNGSWFSGMFQKVGRPICVQVAVKQINDMDKSTSSEKAWPSNDIHCNVGLTAAATWPFFIPGFQAHFVPGRATQRIMSKFKASHSKASCRKLVSMGENCIRQVLKIIS